MAPHLIWLSNRTETENPVNWPFLANRNRIFRNLKNRNRTVTKFPNILKTETEPKQEKLAFFAGLYSVICFICQIVRFLDHIIVCLESLNYKVMVTVHVSKLNLGSNVNH